MKKLFSTRTTESSIAFTTLLLRVGFGSAMLVNHGLDKLIHFADKAGRFADPLNIGSTTSLALVVFAEFFCAAFVIMGLFTRLAVIPLIIAMSFALFYSNNGQFFGKGELPGLFLIGFLAIIFLGPGRLSLDRFTGK